MLATIGKAILHLLLLVFFLLALLWVLLFFQGTGFNSLFIPRQLGWHKCENQHIGLWYILSCTISYIEWFGLLWLVNQFNFWYGPEWLKPTQMKIAKIATVLVGLITAVCVAAYYITSFLAH